MAQTINTNIMSLTAQRSLSRSQGRLETAMERLSSGLRVNSAKDDAAGLAIAEHMNTQVRGMNVAMRNANDGISLAQVAESGLNEIGSMLQRMRELAVQSANGTNGLGDRRNLDAEFQALASEIARIAEHTTFNGRAIVGTSAGEFQFQIGANQGQTLNITTLDIATASGISPVLIASLAGTNGTDGVSLANTAIGLLDTAIDTVTTQRAIYGAAQSRFESAINNLQIGMENQAAARGRIVDADFAVETAAMVRAQILQQAGTAMVTQANSAPQNVLALLGN